MEFRLHFRGRLKGNGRPNEKQVIRRAIHRQLNMLWEQNPMREFQSWLEPDNTKFKHTIGKFNFIPLVNQRADLVAEIDITLLRPEAPGSIITQCGDIDNRLKTLLDALRMPQKEDELPKDDLPTDQENPFFCLLEDDNLITHLSVTTDRLLEPVKDPLEVILMAHVRIKLVRGNMDSLSLGL